MPQTTASAVEAVETQGDLMRDALVRRRVASGLGLFARELHGLERGSILSVGEGLGHDVVRLAQMFPALEFYAVELEPEFAAGIDARRRAAGLTNVRVVVGDADRMPFRDKAFEVLYARSVLQFLDVPVHAIEAARITRRVAVYRDVANWPWYPTLRRIQAVTLWLRGRRDAARTILHDAHLVETKLSRTKAHGWTYARSFRRSGRFAEVRSLWHDLLWWDLDREVPLIGAIGARFGLRCAVGP